MQVIVNFRCGNQENANKIWKKEEESMCERCGVEQETSERQSLISECGDERRMRERERK